MRCHVETMCRTPFIDRLLRIDPSRGLCAIGAPEYHTWAIQIVGSGSAWPAAVAEDRDARRPGCAKQTQLALANRRLGQTAWARMRAKQGPQAPNKPNFRVFSSENEGRCENKAKPARLRTAGRSKTQTPGPTGVAGKAGAGHRLGKSRPLCQTNPIQAEEASVLIMD